MDFRQKNTFRVRDVGTTNANISTHISTRNYVPKRERLDPTYFKSQSCIVADVGSQVR
jgi:hypothetical protein